MGRRIIPVVEKYTELGLILEYARKVGVRPQHRHARQAGGARRRPLAVVGRLPLEVRPDRRRSAAGPRGAEVATACRTASSSCTSTSAARFPNIRIVKGALNEAARIYAELVKEGAGLEYIDVGGGLGVDYDGSQTNFESSVNYTLEEYANDVVYHIQTVCDDAGVKHPTIVSESGRAIVAYHSVLVFNVLGVAGLRRRGDAAERPRRGSRAAAHRPEGDATRT